MPPISEAAKHRLEHGYAAAQAVEDGQGHQCIAALEKMIPHRPNLSPPAPAVEPLQERRILPIRAVTDDSLNDAYVDFIMYCNPSIALDTDTTELRKIFRAPPKSDGKSFSTFRLFQEIGKLERKEIKTWAQLALNLGVDPPAADRGQSTQKVQQYSVRLKVRDFRIVFHFFQHCFCSFVHARIDPYHSISSLIYYSDGCMLCMLTLSSSIY